MKWSLVPDKEKYAIVIYNFREDKPRRLTLSVGESVHIYEELEGWYYGNNTRNKSVKGVFPKAYVWIKDCVIDRTGAQEVIIPREPPIIQEITSVLREWGYLERGLYVKNNENFMDVRAMIYDLVDWRRQIMSGTLPVDELKEIKHKVTSTIDLGNSILELDLVVRGDNGSLLNPDITGTIHLYRQHLLATERTELQRQLDFKSRYMTKPTPEMNSHSLFVAVKNFVCKIGDGAELLMSLYDATEARFISENYLVKWPREGLVGDLDHLNNLRVLFTDLGTKDMKRERVMLVCQIVRFGSMEFKEIDHRKPGSATKKPALVDCVRRPFGVAAIDITEVVTGRVDSDEDKQHFVPFLQCSEKECLDAMVRRVIGAKEVNQKEHKGQGLWICLKLLHGDLKQAREENSHLVSPSTATARKMGFPEVILPGDVRNDLYLTVCQGEFSRGSKSSDKNVEVTVKVCNEKGCTIPGVISLGGGSESSNLYRSVVYYHEDKPKWFETFKVSIPIDEDRNGAHIKFTFKHRSSNEAKDRVEKPFALCFAKLIQRDGTTLRDTTHDLLVYKIDQKKYDDSDVGYLLLPATRQEVDQLKSHDAPGHIHSNGYHSTGGSRSSSFSGVSCGNGLTVSTKDLLQISTLICSTKLTQNVDLLGILKWRDYPDNLKDNLQRLMKVDGEEVVKFLQDTLDALFNICMNNNESDKYDKLVFEALVFIIGLIEDRKYQHFRPVLDSYIRADFSATLAYKTLMPVLKNYLDNAALKENEETLLKTMTALEYIFKFVVRSRLLFSTLHEGKGREQFEESMQMLLQAITGLMLDGHESMMDLQKACLRHLPSVIPDVLLVFDAKEFSHILAEMVVKFQKGSGSERLVGNKLACISAIARSDLFKLPESRNILLPVMNDHVRTLLTDKREVETCIDIVSDVMDVLNRPDVGQTGDDVTDIMLSLLRTIIQTAIIDRESHKPYVRNVVAVMIDIFRQMSEQHYKQYINHFATDTDLLDFIMEILMGFKDLVSNSVYPDDWTDMTMLQNSVILKALRYFSHTIMDRFCQPFTVQVWNNFFYCAIAFLTQPALQLENFRLSKRTKIITRYGDMRRETGFEIRSMWYSLGWNRKLFVPDMVGPFLEMTLLPEVELRRATIPIFFDMMQCEFLSPRSMTSISGSDLSMVEMRNAQNSREIKGNFADFENEMITRLDVLIEGGRGDEMYKNLFFEIMSNKCENQQMIGDLGVKFVLVLRRLMERLLEYRSIIVDENKENRMSCIVNLLEFYDDIDRKEMYLRYLHKLCDLHLDCDNYVEAAFTLKQHAKLLRWSEEGVPMLLKSDKYPNCETQHELKEQLYYDIVEYFDKGKLWEAGLVMCKELVSQYENEIYDYGQLSDLLKRMSTFYDNIMKQVRPEPEYFRVAYYGRGFPLFVQNKEFVYRGKEYERLIDFCGRLQTQFPNAQLLTKLTPPGEDITESNCQYLQICKVDPIMDESRKFAAKSVHDQILKYYKVNEVQRFTFSRTIKKGNRDSENEFANLWLERTNLVTSYPLPGILRWFPVTSSSTHEISPLENAIETMDLKNRKLRELTQALQVDPGLPLNPLSLVLSGVVEPAVMGGIANYERAFFTAEFIGANAADKKTVDGIRKLKDLIACQIPILEAALTVHRTRASANLKPFHDRLEKCFGELKTNVEEKYGKRPAESDNTSKRRYRSVPSFRNRNDLLKASRSVDPSLTVPEISLSVSPSKAQSSSVTRTHSVYVRTNSQQSSPASAQTASSPAIGGPGGGGDQLNTSSGSLKTGGSTSNLTQMGSNVVSIGKRLWEGSGTLRRSGGSSSILHSTGGATIEPQSQTQWYDGSKEQPQAVIELNEELTCTRPPRPESDRWKSVRPSSEFFPSGVDVDSSSLARSSPRGSDSLLEEITSSLDSNSKFLLDSNLVDREEEAPPPLPVKAGADYNNADDFFSDCVTPPSSFLRHTVISSTIPRSKNKPLPPLPVDENSPPPPPRRMPSSASYSAGTTPARWQHALDPPHSDTDPS